MLDAIHTGLFYGVLIGFITIGFGLTILTLYWLIELLTLLLGVHSKYFTSGDSDGRGNQGG